MASRSEPTLPSLVRADVQAALRRPLVVAVSLAVVIVAPLSGLAALPGTAFDHWVSYFTVMLDWVAVVFPLLIAVLTQMRLVDEWSNTFAWYTRTRVSAGRYFASKALSSAVLVGSTFFVMTVVCFVVARVTFTDHGFDVPLVGPIETRYDLSQLWAIHPLLYVAVYSVWVGLVTGLVAIWSTCLTALIPNRVLALIAPFLLWTMTSFGLAVIRLEAFALPPFRFFITQQPMWAVLPGLALILVTIAIMWAVIRAQDFQTPGIVRR